MCEADLRDRKSRDVIQSKPGGIEGVLIEGWLLGSKLCQYDSSEGRGALVDHPRYSKKVRLTRSSRIKGGVSDDDDHVDDPVEPSGEWLIHHSGAATVDDAMWLCVALASQKVILFWLYTSPLPLRCLVNFLTGLPVYCRSYNMVFITSSRVDLSLCYCT